MKAESSDDIDENTDSANQHWEHSYEAHSPAHVDDMEVGMEPDVGDQPMVEHNGSKPFDEAVAERDVGDQPMVGDAGQPNGGKPVDEAVADPEDSHSASAPFENDGSGMALCDGDVGAAACDGDAGMASEDPLEDAVGQDQQLPAQPPPEGNAIGNSLEDEENAHNEENAAGPVAVPPERPPAAAADAAAEAAPRSSGPKVHSTPEILQRLEPCPTFKIRLNFCDHRFTLDTLTKVKDDRWIDKFAQKSFSRGFKINRDWKSALQAVHEHTWQKWSLAKDKHPLAPGVAEQTPGEIDPDIFTDLAPVIAAMPAPKY